MLTIVGTILTFKDELQDVLTLKHGHYWEKHIFPE